MIKNLIKKILKKYGYVSKWSLPNQKDKFDSLYVLLFALQKNRDPFAVASGATGSALIEEILLEKRKETYGDAPAVEWFDAKRLGRGIPRTGNQRLKGNSALTANDKRFFLKVPQREIDANDNITEAVNAYR